MSIDLARCIHESPLKCSSNERMWLETRLIKASFEVMAETNKYLGAFRSGSLENATFFKKTLPCKFDVISPSESKGVRISKILKLMRK